MDKLHELDTKCAGAQTALKEEKNRNADLISEMNSNKSKVRNLICSNVMGELKVIISAIMC